MADQPTPEPQTSITIAVAVPYTMLLDLMYTILDNMVFSAWADMTVEMPPDFSIDQVAWLPETERASWGNVHTDYLAPWFGTMDFVVEEKHGYSLTLEAMAKGLAVMAIPGSEGNQHLADILSENGDRNTADCFLQFCLFGKLIYD